jgi:hypothetical protein
VRRYCTLTPAAVRAVATRVLEPAFPWQPFRRSVPVAALLALLLLMAARRLSLSAAARRFAFGCSHETARRAVRANLPALPELADRLGGLLRSFADRAWRRRRWDLAIDLHYAPFYGDPAAPGVVGGPKKGGTNRAYAYATAVLLHRRRRYTVACLPLTAAPRPHHVVEAVLAQVRSAGLRVRGVVLDSGFDGGDVLLALRRAGLAYVVPLRRKGRGPNARNRWFDEPAGAEGVLGWKTEAGGRPVETRVVVVRRRGRRRTDVFAFGGWAAARARAAADRWALDKYRQRFGVETSYRQLNQAKAPTTTKDARLRLLLVGLALLLRQVWVWLTGQLNRGRPRRAGDWVAAWPLARQNAWLADAIEADHPERTTVPLSEPLVPPTTASR